MQYRARIIADRSGLSCNLIKSISRPRWTLNIAENGVAFCGGAEASLINHLILLGHHASLWSGIVAFAYLVAAILHLDDRKALCAAYGLFGPGRRLVDTNVQHTLPAQPRLDCCKWFSSD
jgi:hypothetical protein